MPKKRLPRKTKKRLVKLLKTAYEKNKAVINELLRDRFVYGVSVSKIENGRVIRKTIEYLNGELPELDNGTEIQDN